MVALNNNKKILYLKRQHNYHKEISSEFEQPSHVTIVIINISNILHFKY